ncbi:MAG: NAD(P)-dependent oxidoreductase [Oscillospiraceae bacterium]|nr:NAD(P)-dependent oxidoreductase [Oscillospiraceae bacterium]
MKRVVITGADGFIGNALSNKLKDNNVDVIEVTLEKSLPKNLNNIDVFFHFAREGGYSKDSFKNTKLQIQNLTNDCDAVYSALEVGAKRFIYPQTYNYLEIKEFISGNISNPRYTNIYSASKTAAEVIGKTIAYNSNLDYISGACSMMYGPGNYHADSFSSVLIRNLIHGDEVKCVAGENLYDMVFINDIVDAFIAIANHGKNLKTYYIGHRKLKTFKEIVLEIRDIINPECKITFGAYPEAPQIIDWSDVGLDDLYNDTGFECSSDLRESILYTVNWVKSCNNN